MGRVAETIGSVPEAGIVQQEWPLPQKVTRSGDPWALFGGRLCPFLQIAILAFDPLAGTQGLLVIVSYRLRSALAWMIGVSMP
jgi:hypothetical protein